MKERKIFRLLGTLFLILGLITIGIGIVLQIRNNDFFKTAETTEAYIDTIDVSERTSYRRSSKKYRRKTTHTVYVSYEIDGTTYDNVSLNYYSSGMQEGDTITVYYDPDHPYDIQVKGTQYLAILISSIIGFIFALVGGILLIVYYRFQKKRKLITNGKCIKLPIAKIGVNYNVHVNGHPGYYIICEKGQDTSASRDFYKSDNYFDPEFDLRYQVGDLVPIYIDPENPEKYFMDVEHTESNISENAFPK